MNNLVASSHVAKLFWQIGILLTRRLHLGWLVATQSMAVNQWMYPLVNIQKLLKMAIESSWIYPLKIVISHRVFYVYEAGLTELIKHILQSTKTSRDGSNIIFEHLSFNPIGSRVLLYMVTWIPPIYPLYVSIYTSNMDPMGIDLGKPKKSLEKESYALSEVVLGRRYGDIRKIYLPLCFVFTKQPFFSGHLLVITTQKKKHWLLGQPHHMCHGQNITVIVLQVCCFFSAFDIGAV